MSQLIPWEAARQRVLDGVSELPPTRIVVNQALGMAVSENVLAPESMPPFDNSAMDGFAARAEDIAAAGPDSPVTLNVIGNLPAGAASGPLVGRGEAARIMTGAPVPDGADVVVPVEDTNFWDAEAVRARPPGEGEGEMGDNPGKVLIRRAHAAGTHVRRVGESVQAGETFLEKGHVIRGQEVALLLSVGIAEVNVHPLPRVGVLSTGDELVPPDARPGPGQIRDSNRAGLLATLARNGFPGADLGLVADDAAELARRVLGGADTTDFLLTSGGVSVGDRDLTRQILAEVGEVAAYRVAVKPGKPQLFGHVRGTPVFGLPGNPVSSLVVFDQFVLPALRRMAGRREVFAPVFAAELAEPVRRRPGRTEFIRVRLEATDGRWRARPTGPQGSGVLSSMTRANGYAIIPADTADLPAGAPVSCQLMMSD